MTQLTYFLITRKLFDSPIWRDDPHILKLFIYLIGRARFLEEPKRFQGFDLKRGELLTSLSEIADDNEYLVQGRYIKKWSRQKVSRMLTHLQNNEYISLLSDTYGTHISIRNYDQYQSQENYGRTPVEHQRDTSGTPAGIYKNDKNDKNDKKTFSQNSNEFRLSELLFTLIKNRRDSFKPPDLQKWSIHIDRMIRIDNREIKEIEEIIKWSHQDLFWRDVILSTVSLRDKFDKLAIRKDSQTQGGSSPVSLSPSFEFNTRDL